MKNPLFISWMMTGLICMLTGCNDPNESGVTDTIDFKQAVVSHDRINVTTDVFFYSHYGSKEFFYYFDRDSNGEAEYLIRCNAESFTIFKELLPNTGLFDVLIFGGTPVITGNQYHLEFPLWALEINPDREFSVWYWFFEITERDRMPNSGSEVLANVL